MEYSVINIPSAPAATVRLARFSPSGGGSGEAHAIVTCTPGGTARCQIDAVADAARKLSEDLAADGLRPVMARWLLSDAANQAPLLPRWAGVAASLVEQPPMDGSKCALWLYFIEATECTELEGGLTKAVRPDYSHILAASLAVPGCGSQTATAALLEDFDIRLGDHGTRLADGCIRTWFFVRDVDHFYSGVVRGRNEVFANLGLTPRTHFIASTGIQGGAESPDVTVKMDAWAVPELKPEQIVYIQAPEHLNPTYEYGVAFERATAVDYGDRRHLIVSGTASIDNKGHIVAPGDIEGQTHRMLENVEALLAAGGMTWHDVAHRIVYLRDWADYRTVRDIFDRPCAEGPDIPTVIVRAPVCRPGWLIEMECMAVADRHNPDFAPF